MIWINFLHLYQPGSIGNRAIEDAIEKSYARIAAALEKNPHIKFTLNISGCLLLRIEELGFDNLIERFRKLIKNGQLELVGSASYHPLLPLIPVDEAKKQIKENEGILKKYFGENLKLQGFFLPEMAYSSKVGKLIKSLGYKWIILDEISATEKINPEIGYEDAGTGLKVIFRSRKVSQTFVPETLLSSHSHDIIITATDGELYGLRHNDPTGKLEKLLTLNHHETQTVSEFINKRSLTKKIVLRPSNWESTEEELGNGLAYALWYNENNPLHKELWKLAGLAHKTLKKFKNDSNCEWADWHFKRGLASCTFWWASAKDFRDIFGPLAWSPDDIERGVNDLVRAIRSIKDKDSLPQKLRAEKLNAKIRRMIWEKHWTQSTNTQI